jgi:hypothetical protein
MDNTAETREHGQDHKDIIDYTVENCQQCPVKMNKTDINYAKKNGKNRSNKTVLIRQVKGNQTDRNQE